MRLDTFTDYSLRALIFAAARDPALSQISEIAESHRISTAHLTKVVQQLGHGGFLETLRGRGAIATLLELDLPAARPQQI